MLWQFLWHNRNYWTFVIRIPIVQKQTCRSIRVLKEFSLFVSDSNFKMHFLRVEINKRKQFVKFQDVYGITIKTLVGRGLFKIWRLLCLFICIFKFIIFFPAVQSFGLKDVKGNTVKIYDALDTAIDTDEVLKHVIQTSGHDDFIKIVFEKPEAESDVLTSIQVNCEISSRVASLWIHFVSFPL